MTPPTDYYGPLGLHVPYGYVDATCWGDKKAHGIPAIEHPYYVTKSKVHCAVSEYLGRAVSPERIDALVDAIMEAL